MFEMQNADIALGLLQFLKGVKPLFEGESLDNVITGLAEAKKTIAEKDAVVALINESNAKIVEANQAEENARQAKADLQSALDSIANREGQLRDDRASIQPGLDKNIEDAAANDTREKDLNARQAVIEAREATILADLESASEAKKKAQDRLALLNQVGE